MTTPPPPGSSGPSDESAGPTRNAGNPFSPDAGNGPVYGGPTPQQPSYGQTPPPAPGQPNPYGQAPQYGQQPQPGAAPQYGQTPGSFGQPGQPGQPFGAPQPGGTVPPGGFPPVPGAPGMPGTPGQPPSNNDTTKKITRAVVGVAVIALIAIVAVFVWAPWKGDDGKSVDRTAVGSCITVEKGTGSGVETEAVDCADTTAVSFVVGAKFAETSMCEAAGLNYYVTEYGTGASDDVLCLTPNYVVGTCYEESSISIGIGLETVACTEESTIMSAVFKITERVESENVPNCTDAETQKVQTATVQTSPERVIGVCAEILGDYTWE